MNIKQALKKSKKMGGFYISSNSIGMFRQDPTSLVHWLFVNPTGKVAEKMSREQFFRILDAQDWELDSAIVERKKK